MTVTLEQARAELAELIHQLTPGEEVVITENEKPVARLVAEPQPAPPPRREPGLWKGKLTILSDDDEHLKDFEECME
jgi:antitoxin (DNA-binding transcriptional repressor) of toxin-antitoxin stability system